MVGSQFLTQEHKVFLSIPQQLFGDDGAPSTLFFSALMEMIAAHMQSLQIKKNNNKTEKRLGLKWQLLSDRMDPWVVQL